MSNQIITQLSGGLGNQMFMYAAARALALRTNAELRLDCNTGFARDVQYKRKYALNHFRADILRTSTLDGFDYIGGAWVQKVSRRIGRHIPFLSVRYILENRFPEPTQLLKLSPASYFLEGYWQSEDFFADCADTIRRDFQITKSFPETVLQEAEMIRNAGSRGVALCVRRYQEVKNFVQVSVVDKAYYLKAMSLIAREISNPVFYCFTQQPDWVKEQLGGEYDIRFISPKSEDDGAIDDLYLMTQCRNFIISNSTFYWWGAWLADADRVIAPEKWVFNGTPLRKWRIIGQDNR